MEPIKWDYNVNENLSPKENIKKLLKLASISGMEFSTKGKLLQKLPHIYKIYDVSINGDVSYVNEKLTDDCKKFKDYITTYLKGDDAIEELLWSLDEARYLIHEYLLYNQEYSYFLPQLPNTFVLYSLSNGDTIDVTLSQIHLTLQHKDKINQHLEIRSKHFILLDNYLGLIKERLLIDANYDLLINPKRNQEKEEHLLEVWLALQNLGFLDHAGNDKMVLAKSRRKFFEVFQLTDINYKKLRAKILENKNPTAKILPKLEKAFLKAAEKIKKKPTI